MSRHFELLGTPLLVRIFHRGGTVIDLAIAAATAELRHFLSLRNHLSDMLPRDRSTLNIYMKTELAGLNYVGNCVSNRLIAGH